MLILSGDLLVRLEQLGQDESIVFERQRRERLDQRLAESRREIRTPRIVIPAPKESLLHLHALPEEIQLEPGELRVRFSTLVELLQRLMLLAQCISEDWEAFEDAAKTCSDLKQKPILLIEGPV